MTITTTLCLIVFALAAAFLISRIVVKSEPESEVELMRVTRKNRGAPRPEAE